RRDENRELEQRVGELHAYIDQSMPFVAGRRLTDEAVVVVAVRGVDPGVVRESALALRAAGARLDAIVWLEPSLVDPDPGSRARLSAALTGVPLTGTPSSADSPLSDDQGSLSREAAEALARRLGRSDSSGLSGGGRGVGDSGPTGPAEAAGSGPGGSADLLSALVVGGFVTLDSLGEPEPTPASYPSVGALVVVIDGWQARLAPVDVTLPLVRRLSVEGKTVVLAEATEPGLAPSERGQVVRLVRDDGELALRVGTVDGLEEAQGRAALVLALDQVGRGGPGHFGRAPGASRQLPELAG
ncbi:MAG: copper transporter, partial [Acidimicrobiia bacterium]